MIDNDLGFVAYLCMALNEAGYTAVPTIHADRALPLVRELGIARVDLLVANLTLPGVPALVEGLQSKHTKVIMIEEPRIAAIKPIPVDGILRRPDRLGPTAEAEWLRTVRRILGEAA